MTILPVRDDPVKVIASISGCDASTVPTSMPFSLTELITPGGSSVIDAMHSMIAALIRGVCGASLMTVVQPAARAGASDRISKVTGAFHGTITETTPAGSRVRNEKLPGALSSVRPKTLRARPA